MRNVGALPGPRRVAGRGRELTYSLRVQRSRLIEPCATRPCAREVPVGGGGLGSWDTAGWNQTLVAPQPSQRKTWDLTEGALVSFWAEEGFDQSSVLGEVLILPLSFKLRALAVYTRGDRLWTRSVTLIRKGKRGRMLGNMYSVCQNEQNLLTDWISGHGPKTVISRSCQPPDAGPGSNPHCVSGPDGDTGRVSWSPATGSVE